MGDVRDEMADDPAYVEACRVSAWSEQPMADIERHWDRVERRYIFPAGWPPGVDAAAFVRGQLAQSRSPVAGTAPSRSDPASPSVKRLREMLR